MAFFGVSRGINSLSSAFASSGVKAFLLPLVPLLAPFFPFLRVANMFIFRKYTTDHLGRLGFLPAIPSFVDPDEKESFSVSYNSPKNYFIGQMGARPKPFSVKSDPSFGGVRKVRRLWLLMASIPLLWVFLLPMIGVLLGGTGVGLPGRSIVSGRRGISGVLARSVRTGVIGSSLWDFLGVGILGILWGGTVRGELVTMGLLSEYK